MLRFAKCLFPYKSIIQRNSDPNSEEQEEIEDLMTRCAVIHFACISLNHPLNRAVTEQKAPRVYSALSLFIYYLEPSTSSPPPHQHALRCVRRRNVLSKKILA